MLDWLLHGTISLGPLGDALGGGTLSVREVVGNVFGLASAVLGMRRLVWAWPIGLVGNILLFTVFVSGELSNVTAEPLWGQAGRQVMFAAVSAYGWWRWHRNRHQRPEVAAVQPRWATTRERLQLLALAAVGYVAALGLLQLIGSYSPTTEAWILAGSLLATFGMARGWIEFWLVWVAVDVVGVTTLVQAGYYPTAAMYVVYGAFCVVGFLTWRRTAATTPTDGRRDEPVDEHVPYEGVLP